MTREVIARAPPPAFLFPNQQCQRPEPPSGDPIVLRPMSAEAAIYPTPNSVSNRFLQNVPTKPPNQPKGQSNNPKRPSKEQRLTSQEDLLSKDQINQPTKSRNSCENLNPIPGNALLEKHHPPCQPQYPLNFSKRSKLNTSLNLGILRELPTSGSSGASIEASPQSQPP